MRVYLQQNAPQTPSQRRTFKTPGLAITPFLAQPKLKVSTPGDQYEQEADRVASHVMRMPEPQLQRSCVCGGDCPRCQGEQPHPAHKALQTKHFSGNEAVDTVAPPIVDEVLRSAGQPLDSATRAFFEPRFGHNFGQVHVHTGAKASESAQAVNALAYTVGQHVVFRENAFSPGTTAGKHLLAHELAHVTQQEKGRTLAPGVERSNDSQGHEAAGDSVQREPAARLATARLLQRTGADAGGRIEEGIGEGLDGQPTPEPMDDKPKAICGPDVTKQLKDAQLKTRKKFGSWTTSRKESACQSLVSIVVGGIAWDIVDLNESGWILANYGSKCATESASPSCGKSIQIDKKCFYAGSVNYVHFGNMFDLCQGHYAVAYPLNKQFTQNEMLRWINLYKGDTLPWRTPARNLEASLAWATAGFFNWPHGALTPDGDRSNCSPTCSLPYTGRDFVVNWDGEDF